MNKAILQPNVQLFIQNNLKTDINKLIFKGSPFENITIQELANQILAKQKSEKKLSQWFNTKDIYYPEKLSIEQTSSEITAALIFIKKSEPVPFLISFKSALLRSLFILLGNNIPLVVNESEKRFPNNSVNFSVAIFVKLSFILFGASIVYNNHLPFLKSKREFTFPECVYFVE